MAEEKGAVVASSCRQELGKTSIGNYQEIPVQDAHERQVCLNHGTGTKG